MRLFSLPDILALSANTDSITVRLSPDSLTLFLAMEYIAAATYRWRGSDIDGLTASEIDQIDALVSRAYKELISSAMIGCIVPHAMSTLPDYLLPCDGGTYPRDGYPLLYAALDSTYIIDGSNFRTPDLRGRFLLGANSSHALDSSGGAETHTLTIDEIPAHSHSYVPPTLNVDLEDVGVPDIQAAGVGLPTDTGATGGGQAHNNMPPFLTLRYAIVAR